MIKRPYLQYEATKLYEFAQANKDSLEELELVLFELRFRSSKYARFVESQVQALIQDLLSRSRISWDAFLVERSLYSVEAVDKILPLDLFELQDHKFIGITGDNPYKKDLLRSLVFWQGSINSENYLWANGQVIVIGREDFDTDYLQRTIEIILSKQLDISFIAQEEFLDLLLYNEEPGYYFGDPRIRDHPGLAFLSSVGFVWPSTYAEPRKSKGGDIMPDWSAHRLSSVYGYSVRQGVSVGHRQRALSAAVVPPPRGLGLEEVVRHIAGLVRFRKETQYERMRNAIHNWEADLAWLYETYYKHSIYSFSWPEY